MSLFSDLGFASVVKGGPGPNKAQEDRQTLKNGPRKGHHFRKNSVFFVMFFRCVLEGSCEVFFCALGAEVSQMGATWGYFSSYVAAKLES